MDKNIGVMINDFANHGTKSQLKQAVVKAIVDYLRKDEASMCLAVVTDLTCAYRVSSLFKNRAPHFTSVACWVLGPAVERNDRITM